MYLQSLSTSERASSGLGEVSEVWLVIVNGYG
jgi:hypothetical protein